MILNYRFWSNLRFALLLTLVISALAFPFEFRNRYESSPVAPSQEYFQELLRIRNYFGYGNQSNVIFVRYDVSVPNRLAEWTSAITGMPIYVGSSPFYYLAHKIETLLLDSAVYVGQTNNLEIHGLFGRPLVLSSLLSVPTGLDLINSTTIGSGLFLSRVSQPQALALIPLVQALANGSALPPTPDVKFHPLNLTNWQIYLAKGGYNNATFTTSDGNFSITLVGGSYFVRLYEIFSPALNISSQDFLAIHVWSMVNKQFMVRLSTQSNPILPGGTTNDYATYSFILQPGWQYLVINLSNPAFVTGSFTPSSITQIILYLDRDFVSDQVISDGGYAVGLA
jgi:hypothetical protein